MKYDTIIIGGGPGGYLAAERLAAEKLKVALIEKDEVGGTCLNIGCIPTKTFLNSAKLYVHAREGAAFGIEAEAVHSNWPRIVAWKNEVVSRLRRGLELTLTKEGIEILRGQGRLMGIHTVSLDTGTKEPLTLEADSIIVATGASPIMPPIPGVQNNPSVLDSTGMLALKEVPKSLCIIGGGVIGVEFASLFSSFGSKVTVIEMMHEIVPVMDRQMAMMLRNALKQVTFTLGAKVTAVEDHRVLYEGAGGEKGTVEADVILMAVGRKATVEGWGAQDVGLEIKNRAVATDAHQRTNLPGVWAIGDVTGKSQLAHAAYRMAEVAVADILALRRGEHSVQEFVPETVPWALFSLPEAAGVGYTEDEARAKGYDVSVVRTPYGVSGRFIAENGLSSPGSVKIVFEKTSQRILGVHMLGAYASEHIWGAALALERKLPLSALRNMVFPHPTVSEVLREAAWSVHEYHE
ncbi:MAG TPA: dihydrolipoyl dehydrogenase [Spirochaetaceae bacterium]|jgi:dihydrolipoamide dehydrogenase|nr:dihydrolipoyl dehydrogenase [Spirochaetaceae bacterium]